MQFGKPSLVCDFMELYRYLIDDFVIDYCKNLTAKDFVVKTEKSTKKTETQLLDVTHNLSGRNIHKPCFRLTQHLKKGEAYVKTVLRKI